jgi:hypothetical protein
MSYTQFIHLKGKRFTRLAIPPSTETAKLLEELLVTALNEDYNNLSDLH